MPDPLVRRAGLQRSAGRAGLLAPGTARGLLLGPLRSPVLTGPGPVTRGRRRGVVRVPADLGFQAGDTIDEHGVQLDQPGDLGQRRPQLPSKVLTTRVHDVGHTKTFATTPADSCTTTKIPPPDLKPRQAPEQLP